MLQLGDKYKLYRLDQYNIGIKEWTMSRSKKNNTEEFKWVDLGYYFKSITSALRYIRDNVATELLDLEDYNIDELISAIENKEIEVTYTDSNISEYALKARTKKGGDTIWE